MVKWTHFVSMLFCHLAQAKSLREICNGLKCCLGKLVHLGIDKSPSKSTLCYANQHRPWELYQDLFYKTLEKIKVYAPGRKRKFRFKNRLLSLDASIIELSLKMFPWADYNRTKGAVKLHMLLDHDGYLPVFALVTQGRHHEVNVAHRLINSSNSNSNRNRNRNRNNRSLLLPAQSIVVIDRGYTDYDLYYQWTQRNIWFVTQLRSNAKYQVVEEKPPDSLPANILADQVILFTGKKSIERCPLPMRRVVIRKYNDKDNEETGEQEQIEFLTNHFKFGPTTIAAIYKDRWEIEIFFKALKQNLKIKTFIGTNFNAIQIQIWTALIAMLLIKFLQFKSSINWSLSNLVALLRWNLMSYRNLWLWLDAPFDTPPDNSKFEQTLLPFPDLDSIMQQNMKKAKKNF
ncbi:MAG: IS4 family transposase [Candidatus Aminicenantes bacterium]